MKVTEVIQRIDWNKLDLGNPCDYVDFQVGWMELKAAGVVNDRQRREWEQLAVAGDIPCALEYRGNVDENGDQRRDIAISGSFIEQYIDLAKRHGALEEKTDEFSEPIQEVGHLRGRILDTLNEAEDRARLLNESYFSENLVVAVEAAGDIGYQTALKREIAPGDLRSMDTMDQAEAGAAILRDSLGCKFEAAKRINFSDIGKPLQYEIIPEDGGRMGAVGRVKLLDGYRRRVQNELFDITSGPGVRETGRRVYSG